MNANTGISDHYYRYKFGGEDQHPRSVFLVVFVQNDNKASSHNTLLTMVQDLVVLVITAGLLMWGRIRSDVVALCSMLALVLMWIITPQEGCQASPALWWS